MCALLPHLMLWLYLPCVANGSPCYMCRRYQRPFETAKTETVTRMQSCLVQLCFSAAAYRRSRFHRLSSRVVELAAEKKLDRRLWLDGRSVLDAYRANREHLLAMELAVRASCRP